MKSKSFKSPSLKRVLILFPAFVLVLFFVLAKGKDKASTIPKAGLIKNSTFAGPDLKNFDCLPGNIIASYGCAAKGVDQATLTVRQDGTWDFWVHYCCNISPQSCSKSGGGRSTGPGSLKHAEWSINSQGCLELRVQQLY
jgi:hypothetical protein